MNIDRSLKNQNLVIIDDEIEVCETLRRLFESVQFHVETYNSASHFLEHKTIEQGCLIIKAQMPIMSGLELLELLQIQKSRLPAIIVTSHGDIPMAIRAMRAGAMDFVLKPFDDQGIIALVKKCISQSACTDDTRLINARIKCLTERELQVIELIIEGNLNKQIAFLLSISISTVEAHRAKIMQKMQAKNLAHLIKTYLSA